LNQGRLATQLVDELLEKIHEYDDTLYLPTVLGVLEIIKQQLLQDHTEDEE
jgi:hypothetical protein